MENASKALLIASGILIGVLILTLMASLYFIFSQYAKETQKQITQKDIQTFNQEFLKYDGRTNLSIQEVVSIKNKALESNNSYANYNVTTSVYDGTNNYIGVYIQNKLILTSDSLELLQDNVDSAFTCKVEISNITGKVYKVTFNYTK